MTVNRRSNIIEFIEHVIPYSKNRRTLLINESITKTTNFFMKMHKNVYLALAILLLISFIDSLFYTERTHKLLFWEVNIWVYRLFRLGIAIVFMKSYLDIRSAKKLKEK